MIERIEELCRHEPFTPFALILTSGSRYEVLAPLMIAVGKSEIAYFYPKSDKLAHLRINQLAAIETIESHA